MKKLLLFILIALPVMTFGQTRFHVLDSLTIESDTTIYYQMVDSKNWSFHLYVDSLAGTLDGTVELVVANAFDDSNNFRDVTAPAAAAFVRYTNNMVDILAGNGYYSYFYEYASYEYIGLKFTLNNITKWHIKWLFLKLVD